MVQRAFGGKTIDPNRQRGVEFLALATAAYHVYREVAGTDFPTMDVAGTNALLHDVSRALANVAPLYSGNPDGTYRQLEPIDLIYGVFQRGATMLRTPRDEYTKLSIRRNDMRQAIAILRNAGIKFAAAGSPADDPIPK